MFTSSKPFIEPNPTYHLVAQKNNTSFENIDPFEGEACDASWQNKFKFAASGIIKQHGDSLETALRNLIKSAGLKRRHLFSRENSYFSTIKSKNLFETLLVTHTIRSRHEEIEKRTLYQLIYLDKMLIANTDISSKLKKAMDERFITTDLLLNVYGRIIQQKMDEKRSFQLDEDTQTEANKIFESWLEEWEKFFTHQSPENAQKLKTFVECGIPHAVHDELPHAHQEHQKTAKAEQMRREEEAEKVRQVLKLQALEKPQYSNPYVEAIFRGISEDSDRSFFVFNEYSAQAKPNAINIGVTTSIDLKKTTKELKAVLAQDLFRSLNINKIDIYWENELDQKDPSAINELFKIVEALPGLESVRVYSDGVEDNIIRNNQTNALIQLLRDHPKIKRIAFVSVRLQEEGYKKLFEYWSTHPALEVDIDETNELNGFYERNLRQLSVTENKLLEKKKLHLSVESTDNSEFITFDEIAPLCQLGNENPHKIPSLFSMIEGNRLILRAPTEPVVKANTPAPNPEASIFNMDKLSERFQYYFLNDSEQDASSLNLTLDAEQKHILANLIAALGKERVQFFIQYDKIYGLIDFVQTGRFSIAEITVLDKRSQDYPLSRLAILLAPHKNPLADGKILSAEEIDKMVAYETDGLSPSERFKGELNEGQRQTVGHLQSYYDKVIVPAVKERIRLTQDWKAIESLPQTEETQKQHHLLEQKIGLFTDFIDKSGRKLVCLSSAVEESIQKNKPLTFHRHLNHDHLAVVHSYRDAMNGTAGFETVREEQKNVLNAARHPVLLKVQQFFAAIATIPAVIFGVLTAFQLYSPRDISTMFLTKSDATLFTAQSEANDIERTLLHERTLSVAVH